MDATIAEELQRSNYEIAEAIAPTWERRRPDIEAFSAPVRSWMLHQLAPRAGDTVLDLAAGNGDTGFDAAEQIGPTGRLLSTDFSPSMLASARRGGEALGLTNVEYRVVDAQKIDLGENTVDGVLCRFGLMLVVDPAAALAEIRRVLRPNGRCVVAVWAAPGRNPYFTTIVGVLVAEGHLAPPDPDGPGVFRLADPAHVTALVTAAGFATVRTEEIALSFRVAGVGAYLDLVADTAGPIGLAIARLTSTDRAVVAARVADALDRFATPDGFEIPGAALGVVAS